MRPRAAMWVQTRLGLGHLTRAAALCGGLASEGFDVMLLNGGAPLDATTSPPGVEISQLPPAFAPDLSNREIFDASGNPAGDVWRAQRLSALRAALERFQPDIFLTETFPLGRRLFSFELMPVLDWLRSLDPRPLIAASVRDIVTRPEKASKTNDMISTALRAYDLILCHSDPRVLKMTDTFPETDRLEAMTRYTGYVTAPAEPARENRAGIIVVAGGGAAGLALFETALAAKREWPEDREIWTLVTGPRFGADALDALRAQAPEGLIVVGAIKGLAARYAQAKLVVAQAGYNTVCEALSGGARLTVVPYAEKGETEQTLRAEKFGRLGYLTWTPEAGLTPAKLRQAMRNALEATAPNVDIDFGGGGASARILRQALREHRQ